MRARSFCHGQAGQLGLGLDQALVALGASRMPHTAAPPSSTASP